MTHDEWRTKNAALYRELKAAELDLYACQKCVVEAVLHRDTLSCYEFDVAKAHKRIMGLLPSFLMANVEHARAKMMVDEHRGREPLDCTKNQ